LGRGENISIQRQRVVEWLISRHGTSWELDYLPPENEPRNTLADPALSKKMLKYEAVIPIEAGLSKTWNWFEKNTPIAGRPIE